MPKVFSNNEYWLRGGHMNQKRHIDIDGWREKNIACCPGDKDKHLCKNPVFRCSECGNYGCDQESLDKCSEQGFKNAKCLHCGVVGTQIPVMAEELAKYIAEWKKEVPVIEG